MEVDASICQGDSIFLDGGFQVSAGIYHEVHIVLDSCDSVISTNLTINALPGKPIISAIGGVLTSTQAVYYQWFYNDSLIVAAVNQFYVAATDGYYLVEITDNNGCMAISDSFLVQSTVSIEEIEMASNLRVFPNPTTGSFEFHLNLSANSNYLLNLYDHTGRLILTKRVMSTGTEHYGKLNLSAYNQGIYCLQITGPTETYVARIVYKH